MPDKIEQRVKFYAPPDSQPRTQSPSDSNPGVSRVAEQLQQPKLQNSSKPVVQPLQLPQQPRNQPSFAPLTALLVSGVNNWIGLIVLALVVGGAYAYYRKNNKRG